MVIRSSEDVVELLSERIEAMEDLNCEDLEVCVRSFMALHAVCMNMENAIEMAKHEPENPALWDEAREMFRQGHTIAVKLIKQIDDLTLKTDTAD